MVIDAGDLLYDVVVSSVVPATVTGEDVVHELTNMDLAMKLHYVRLVYYFEREAVEGIELSGFKIPMFPWLDIYCSVAGRARILEGGRVFIKCNDAGIRIIKARCRKSLGEWMEMMDGSLEKLLVSNQVIGPHLHYSPFVFLQFTWFKCGGMSVGLSWSHILGDAFTASAFINMWGQLLAGKPPMRSRFLPRTELITPGRVTGKPLSARQIEPVGKRWIVTNNSKMETFSFNISEAQLKQLHSKISCQSTPFAAISALLWHYIAQIRKEKEPKIVTICRNDPQEKNGAGKLSNKQIIGTLQTDFDVAGAELQRLVELITDGVVKDESEEVEAMVETENGDADFLVYGANLTFVDLEAAEFYGLEIKGKGPLYVGINIDGVGDEGAVLVLREAGKEKGKTGGRMVTVILTESEVLQLRNELKNQRNIGLMM